MKTLKTAPQILEHYTETDWKKLHSFGGVIKEDILKAMRYYSRLKSDIAYEKGFQTAIKLYKLK